MPVLCVVRAVGVQRWEGGVIVASLEALIHTLSHAGLTTFGRQAAAMLPPAR